MQKMKRTEPENHPSHFFKTKLNDETPIGFALAVRPLKVLNVCNRFLGQTKILKYQKKLSVFYKYQFELAKNLKYVIFRAFSREPEIQLANIQVNKDCVSSFKFCFTGQLDKMCQINIFDAVFMEKKTLSFWTFSWISKTIGSKTIGSKKFSKTIGSKNSSFLLYVQTWNQLDYSWQFYHTLQNLAKI